jgi:hypothetical protein
MHVRRAVLPCTVPGATPAAAQDARRAAPRGLVFELLHSAENNFWAVEAHGASVRSRRGHLRSRPLPERACRPGPFGTADASVQAGWGQKDATPRRGGRRTASLPQNAPRSVQGGVGPLGAPREAGTGKGAEAAGGAGEAESPKGRRTGHTAPRNGGQVWPPKVGPERARSTFRQPERGRARV